MKNEFDITILENGVVRVTTGKFDGAMHMSADAFVLWSQRELGGEVNLARGAHGHTHTHGSEGEHEHEHVGGKK